jgi:hypothetical protein
MTNTKNKCAKRHSFLATQIRRICAIALVALIGFSMAACDDGSKDDNNQGSNSNQGNNFNQGNNPFIGNWSGTANFSGQSAPATINVTATGWTFSSPAAGMNESGTYTISGNSATLTQSGVTFGTATLSGSTVTVFITSGYYMGGTGTFTQGSTPPPQPPSNVPGSSSSNAISVSYYGTSGSFPAGLDAVWYTFTKTGSGFFMASDKEYSSTYTADIVVDVYSASLNLMSGPIYRGSTFYTNSTWQDIDVGGSSSSGYNLYATNWSGTYYVKVRPYNNSSSNKGTFMLFAP